MSKRNRSREEHMQYIFALKQMVSREIKRKYARSYLGIVWSVLNPLMMMAIMSMIFTTIFKRSIENFPVYYLTGLILWELFSGATNSSMTSLVDNKNLMIKVKLPKQIFVLARVLTALANFGYTCIAYVLMLIVFHVRPNIYMLCLPIGLFFLILFSLGISYILSIAYVHFADIKHLYGVFMRVLMYMTALFYPVETVAPALQKIIKINPIYSYIFFARECVMYGRCPELWVWLQMIIWGVVMFAIGYVVFRKKENTILQKV